MLVNGSSVQKHGAEYWQKRVNEIIAQGPPLCYNNEEAHVFDHEDELAHYLRFSHDRSQEERIKHVIPKQYQTQRDNVNPYLHDLQNTKSLLITGKARNQLFWDLYRNFIYTDQEVDVFAARDLVHSWSSTYPKVHRYARNRVYHVEYLMLYDIDKSCNDEEDIQNLNSLINERYKYSLPFIATSELDAKTLDEGLKVDLFERAKQTRVDQ